MEKLVWPWPILFAISCAPTTQMALKSNTINTPDAPHLAASEQAKITQASRPAERAPAEVDEFWVKDGQEQIVGIFRPYQGEENFPGSQVDHPFLRAGLPLLKGQMGAREMALNFLNEFFQVKIIAPRWEVDYSPAGGGKGIVQALPADYSPLYRISYSAELLENVKWEQLVDLAIIDMISGNLDSSYERWMVDKTGNLLVVGKSWAFPSYHAAHLRVRWHWHRPEYDESFLPPFQRVIERFNQSKLPTSWQQKLLKLNPSNLIDLLKAKFFLSDASLALVQERIVILQQTIKEAPSSGPTMAMLAVACRKKIKNL